ITSFSGIGSGSINPTATSFSRSAGDLLSQACYRFVGPLGHKPSKRISAVTNPFNPLRLDVQ
ncbi:MAG: hypothetical protein ACK6AO_01700, partial [Planctomycetota bacterium]